MTEDQIEPAIPKKLVVLTNIIVLFLAAGAVVLSYLRIFPFYDPPGLYRPLPGDILFDFVWVYIFSFVAGLVTYVAAPSLSILFWKAHRFLTAGHYKYYVQALDPKATKRSQGRRLIVPAFVALGLATAVSNIRSVARYIFVYESFGNLDESAGVIEVGLPIFFILILIASGVTLLFVPLWLLEDSGAICKKEISGRRITADIEGVGNWYLAPLKGFAGITTILAYLLVAIGTIEWYQTITLPESFPVIILLVPVISIVGAPFLAIAPISVVHACYERSLRRNMKALETKFAGVGLTKVVVELSMPQDTTYEQS
ncbi:MAG: hypothetical protein ACE5H4_02915 [Candidatus Thorarchaeota archaeon]